MDKNLVETSKLISKILRHEPEMFELTVDENGGWLEIDLLLDALNKNNVSISRKTLDKIVEQNDKQRLSISNDGINIRANYGHSIPVLMSFEAIEPPEYLYHGTAIRFINSIKLIGIIPKSRLYVHLSDDITTAEKVGQRHGKPVVLTIKALNMVNDGYVFYKAVNGIWLTTKVPQRYIVFD